MVTGSKDVAVYLAGKALTRTDATPEFRGPEKRAHARYKCEGQVEIFEEHSGLWSWAQIGNISMYGCHVDTPIPYPVGTLLQLRIKAHTLEILAVGEVKVSNSARGMGISLQELSEGDRNKLKDLLQIVSRSLEK
jgi:hypothetical protein